MTWGDMIFAVLFVAVPLYGVSRYWAGYDACRREREGQGHADDGSGKGGNHP